MPKFWRTKTFAKKSTSHLPGCYEAVFIRKKPILNVERKNAKLPLREIAAEIALKVEAIWRKGSIPTVSHTRIVQLFLTYHDKKYSSLLKNIKSRRKQENFQSKIKDLVHIDII